MKASLDSLVRKTIDRAEHCSGWLHKRQRIEPSGEPVKLNLGSGLYVAPGWINIDGSIKTLFVKMPRPVLNVAFPLTQAGDGFSRDEFEDLLREHRFVFHNLKYEPLIKLLGLLAFFAVPPLARNGCVGAAYSGRG